MPLIKYIALLLSLTIAIPAYANAEKKLDAADKKLTSTEPKVGDRFGDWVFACRALAENKTACELAQVIVTEKNQKIARLSVTKNNQTNKLLLTALVPLGVNIPAGVSGLIDQTKLSFTLEACIAAGCIANAPLDMQILKSNNAEQKFTINFNLGQNQKVVTVNGSTKGLYDGIKAIKLQ
jgi:invasion protein IalB